MECPYLENHKVASNCAASIGLMTPSADDMAVYCATEEHYRCPMLLGRILRSQTRKAA